MAVDDTVFEMMLDAVDEEAVFMLDPRGRILTWNRSAEQVKGHSWDDVVGRSFEMLYLPVDVIAGVPYDELEIAERSGSFEGDGWRLRADRRRFRAHTTLTAIRSTEGVLVGFARVTRDLTVTDLLSWCSRVVSAGELCEAALKPVLDIVKSGYFTLDAERRLTSVSTGAARMLGAPVSELLGRPLRECIGKPSCRHFLATLPDRLSGPLRVHELRCAPKALGTRPCIP